jgi:hypothetical protein
VSDPKLFDFHNASGSHGNTELRPKILPSTSVPVLIISAHTMACVIAQLLIDTGAEINSIDDAIISAQQK